MKQAQKEFLKVVVVLLVGVVAIVLLTVWAAINRENQRQAEASQYDPAGTEHVLWQLAKCEKDSNSCLGGFVKMKGSPLIRRIASCSVNCEPAEIGVPRLTASLFVKERIKQIEYIALPGERGWEVAAIRHAKQYVVMRR